MASSNNTAVENLTKELPALTAIGCKWRPGQPAENPTAEKPSRSCPAGASQPAAYFADQATALLGEPGWD